MIFLNFETIINRLKLHQTSANCSSNFDSQMWWLDLGESGTTLQENGQMSTTCTSEDGWLDGDGSWPQWPREKTLVPLKYPMNLNPMVMTNIAMVCWWPIEIDDVPFWKPPFILGIFHGYVSHNQMVYGFLWHKSSLSLNTLNIVLRFSRLSSCSLSFFFQVQGYLHVPFHGLV